VSGLSSFIYSETRRKPKLQLDQFCRARTTGTSRALKDASEKSPNHVDLWGVCESSNGSLNTDVLSGSPRNGERLEEHEGLYGSCRSVNNCGSPQRGGGTSTQAGDKVRFRMSDVFLPTPEAVLAAPTMEEVLEGTIVDFSDSGQKTRVFALVDVIRRQALVVPVEKLESVPPNGPEQKADA
jgi:hypothetical protein